MKMCLPVVCLLLMLHLDPISDVTGLTCVQCDSWDNKSRCLEGANPNPKVQSAVDEKCDDKPPTGKVAMCITIYRDVCQPTIFKNYDDLKGNGGERAKRHWTGGCVYVDPNSERLKKYKKCYWERLRGGRDLLHRGSGFQVIGRSVIKRTCYCSTDKCNTIDAVECSNVVGRNIPEPCGPNCNQVSRDQLETPGVEKEEFRDMCPKENEKKKDAKKKDKPSRVFEDCGTDPLRYDADTRGTERQFYRHTSWLGRTTGIRGVATSLAADIACLLLTAVVVGYSLLT